MAALRRGSHPSLFHRQRVSRAGPAQASAQLGWLYLGSLAKAASGERTHADGEWVLYGVGLLAAVVVTFVVTRIAKQALTKKIEA